MNNKNLNIIARYNENISWIEKLNGDILIYNKGNNFPFDYPRSDIPNIGREAETFIRAIVENYNYIKEYKNIVFLQGHPFDHCTNLFEKIESNQELGIYESLANYGARRILPEIEKNSFLFDKHLIIFEKLFDKNITKLTYNTMGTNGIIVDSSKELIEAIYFLDFLNISYKNMSYIWGHGAQYIVKSCAITNKSFEWWNDLLKFFLHCWCNLKNDRLAHYFETFWPLIWTHST